MGGVQIRRRRSSFSHLVAALEADGHDVVAMSRSSGVDVVTGDGLAGALSGVECVIDVATGPSSPGAPIPEIAGPRVEGLVEMATLLASWRGDELKVEGVSDPDDPDRELFETDGLLPGPDATLAGPTFEEWHRQPVMTTPAVSRPVSP